MTEVAKNMSPQQAIGQYLEEGFCVPMGELDPEEILRWQAVVKPAILSPEELFHATWMTVDYCQSVKVQAYHSEAAQPGAIAPALERARQDFDLVARNPKSERLLKIQAAVARNGMPIYTALLAQSSEIMLKRYNKIMDDNAKSATWALEAYRTTGDPRYEPLLQSLTLTMLLGECAWGSSAGLPIASRLAYVPETQFSTSMIVGHSDTKKLAPVRIAPTGPTSMVVLDPELLQNHDYPSKDGHGTLEALLKFNKDMRREGIRRRIPTNPDRAAEHVLKVFEAMNAALNNGITNPRSETYTITAIEKRAAEQYASIPAKELVWQLDTTQLQGLIHQLKGRYEAGSLSSDDMLALGWLNVESAMEMRINGHSKLIARQQFRDARQALTSAAEAYAPVAGAEGKYYLAAIDAAAVGILESIASPVANGEEMDAAQATYHQKLIELSNGLLEYVSEEPELSDQAATDVHQAMQILTTCLALVTEGGGAYLGTPASLRQRSPADHKDNWQVSVWSYAKDGFRGEFYGKARITDTEEMYEPLERGIICIPPSSKTVQDAYALLWNVTALAEGNEIDIAAQEQIQALFKRLSLAIDRVY